ncbi:MAG TPA: hypothetical protein DGD08_14615, partial [Gemmatimonas aurantiaca]|nr:hypothetical protein [Gemmatimonas aurantiaca]
MMGPTTVAVTAALLVYGFAPSTPAATAPSAAKAITLNDGAPVRGRVHAIEVAPAASGAEVVIAADSGLTLAHFTLEGPSRIVIDLGGANLAMRSAYDGKARGPIRNVRLSQYRADTVRLVIDLDASRRYTVQREGNSVRVALTAPAVAFTPWASNNVVRTTTAVAAGHLDVPVSAPTTKVETAKVEAPKV